MPFRPRHKGCLEAVVRMAFCASPWNPCWAFSEQQMMIGFRASLVKSLCRNWLPTLIGFALPAENWRVGSIL